MEVTDTIFVLSNTLRRYSYIGAPLPTVRRSILSFDDSQASPPSPSVYRSIKIEMVM
jgi:hypothetical protein